MSSIFVTASGFQKKTLIEIKADNEALIKSIWGDDADLDPLGPIGQLISQLVKRDSDLWDGAEEIYNSRNPDSATGVSQDNLYLENGIRRLPATKSTVRNVILLGDNSTVITSGKIIKNPDKTALFTLDDGVTIDRTVCREGRVSVPTAVEGNHYILSINSVAYDYTAIHGDDGLAILAGLKNLIDIGGWDGSATILTDDAQLQIFNTSNLSFNVNANLKIESIGINGNFTCTTTGANTIPSNSLTEITTSVTGWTKVYNPDAGVTGGSLETDEDFRIRRENSINNGSATDDAIREAILNDVENVTGCVVISNRTDEIDVESRPAHSFEAIVSGGLDADIAAIILLKQGAGCESYGNTSVTVFDSEGYEQIIKFSRAVTKYIWVRISRSLYLEEIYPDDGDDQIKSNIVIWSLISTNIDVGKDIIRQRLSIPIYQVPGIKDLVIEVAKTDNPGDTPTYAQVDLSLNARERGSFDVSRIIVQDI